MLSGAASGSQRSFPGGHAVLLFSELVCSSGCCGPSNPRTRSRCRAEECCTVLFSAALQGSLCHGDVCVLGGVPRELLTVLLDSQECLAKVWGNGWHHTCAHPAARVHSLGEVGGRCTQLLGAHPSRQITPCNMGVITARLLQCREPILPWGEIVSVRVHGQERNNLASHQPGTREGPGAL